jgi:hypothetical protein
MLRMTDLPLPHLLPVTESSASSSQIRQQISRQQRPSTFASCQIRQQ